MAIDEAVLPSGAETVPLRRWKVEPARVAAWVAVFVVPAALHLAYGVHDVGLVEEWGINQLFAARDSVVFWTPSAGSGLEGQAIRPLTVAAHSIAFLLDPNSFAWYHLLNAVALGAKGLAMLALLVQLGVRRSLAIGGAVVFALFPAWTGLFTFRMIHAQFALAALAFALAQLVAHARRPSPLRAGAIAVSLALSLLSYEVGYVVVLLAPAIVFVVLTPTWKEVLRIAAVWYAVPLLNGIRVLAVLRSGQPLYQRDIVTRSPRHPVREVADMTSLVVRHGFGDFVGSPFGKSVSAVSVLAILGVAATTAASTATARRRLAPPGISDRKVIALAVGSLVAAPVVVLIYAGNAVMLADPLRVFSIASLPLTLALAAAAELIARRREVVAVAAVVVLAALATAAADAQRDVWHERSVFQEHVMGAILATSDLAPAATSLIVVDPERVIGGPNGDLYRFIPEYVRLAALYLDPSIGQVLVCHQAPEEMPPGTSGTSECSNEAGVVSNYLGSATIATSAVIEIRSAEQTSWPTAPTELPTHRARAILHCVASSSCDDGPDGVQARLLPVGAAG